MASDGELALTIGDLGDKQRYSLSFQALPWLDASFRFSRVGKTWYDRSFGLKVRLVRESADFPDVSVGLRDILGTGVYSAEYVVASKHIGDFDVTAGLGWGRMADNAVFSNPFGYIFNSFKYRSSVIDVAGPGTVNFGQFFHGRNTGVFGGFTWQTPIENLKFLAEYSSDQYSFERSRSGDKHFNARSPVNIGLSYRPIDAIALTAGWFYGTTYGFTVSVGGNTAQTYGPALRIGPKVPAAVIRTDAQQASALSIMMTRNKDIGIVRSGGAWVHVPTESERTRQTLLQTYFSETRSVRDVDILGKSLVVDARFQNNPQTQCAGYAQIALASRSELKTLALTDLQNPDGLVVFCNVADAASHISLAATNASGGQAAAVPDVAALKTLIGGDLARQNLRLTALSVGESELWIYFENYRYNDTSEAAGRVIRVLMADAPPSVEIFHLVFTLYGVPMRQITITRSAVERMAVSGTYVSDLATSISTTAPPSENPVLDEALSTTFPTFSWGFTPKLTEQLFDPDKPLQFNLYAEASAAVTLAPGLTLSTNVTGSLWNDLTFNRKPYSSLPHVRSDLLKYLKHGQYGISSLQMIYRTRLTPEVMAVAKAGYLEDMFMGAGGQLLWTPEKSRFSFGADLYEVWQRDYNRLFGLRGYHVLTGHATVYYRSPWHDINFAVHAGRYLAGDYGATFEISRRLFSGVEIGAWATFTNVPFHKFGEGSFDKGIMIHIPLEWWLPIFSQSSYDLVLHSLTRDGGQRLTGDDSLFETVRRFDEDEIDEHLDELGAP